MNDRFRMMALLIASVLVLAWGGHMVADTTFSWSAPDNTGTLTYTGLCLSGATLSGTTTISGAASLSSTLAVAGETTLSSNLVLQSSTADIRMSNSVNTGTCSITFESDIATDAGDRGKLIWGDGTGLVIQSDIDVEGTYATKLTMAPTGVLTLKGGATVDNTTDTGILNLTETAIKATGTFEVTGASTLTGAIGANGALTAATNAQFNGQVTLGDGGDTVNVDSSDWDISTTGDATGLGSVTFDGTLSGGAIVVNANKDLTAVTDNAATTNILVSNGVIDAAMLNGTCAAINGASITALSATNVTAGGAISAIDGAAITNLTAANIATGGTLPALDGSALTGIIGSSTVTNIFGGLQIATATAGVATSTVTITALDIAGTAMTGKKAFPFWWTTTDVSTVATTNGIASFNLTKGTLLRYDWIKDTTTTNLNVVEKYLMETDADGTFILSAVSDSADWTNVVHAVSANGAHTNLNVAFQ